MLLENGTSKTADAEELEEEILELQNTHAEEIESLRAEMNSELDQLKEQLQTEQNWRKKLQNDMQEMKVLRFVYALKLKRLQ